MVKLNVDTHVLMDGAAPSGLCGICDAISETSPSALCETVSREDEFGLYINLGSYSRSSVELERNRAKLRLIDGEQFVEMVLQHYPTMSPRFRGLIPLKQIYVPDLPKP